MDNNLFAPLDPHHFPPHVPEHRAARTHESAIAEAFARGAGGVDGNGRHAAEDAADDLMAVLHGVEAPSTPFGGAR